LLFPQLQGSKYVIRLSRLQMKNSASKWYKVGIILTPNYRRVRALRPVASVHTCHHQRTHRDLLSSVPSKFCALNPVSHG